MGCLLVASSALAATVRFTCPPLKEVRVVNYDSRKWKVYAKFTKEIEGVGTQLVEGSVYVPIRNKKPNPTEFDMIGVIPFSILGYKIHCHYFGSPSLVHEDIEVKLCKKIHDNLVQCETRQIT